MNSKEFHRQTILGLDQTTINRAYLDLTRRNLLEVNQDVRIVNWNNLRTLTNEINWLFERPRNSRREGQTLANIITEIHTRAPLIYTTLLETRAFDEALKSGIKAYSQHIKGNNLACPPNFIGFRQSLDEQFHWGILHLYRRNFQINSRTSRYLEYRTRVQEIIDQFFQENGANLTYNQAFNSAKQDCCWCLFNYKKLPLYRTVLREYIEDVYYEADQELQRQGLGLQLTGLINRLETYFNTQCTNLHFNLATNSARLISALRYRQLQRRQNMNNLNQNQQDLAAVLNAVFGATGLNIPQVTNNLTNAIGALNAAPPRELSIVKISDFYGKDSEDPYEWIDQFERAAEANRWQDGNNGRLVAIAKGYFKDAAADWVRDATAQGANNRIVRWYNANHLQTSLKSRLIEKFASETKQNVWYQELMTTRQLLTESVDDYSLRFKRLLRKVNPDPAAPVIADGLQVRMYLFGLSPALTPLVSTAAPADLNAAIERARLVEAGYNYTPTAKSLTSGNDAEVDDLTKRIEQLSLNYATLASALAVQTSPTTTNSFRSNRQTNRSQPGRPSRQNEDRTCYNCNRTGHIARNCPAPRKRNQDQPRQTHFNNSQSVHYLDLQDEMDDQAGYYTEEDEYEEESELYQYEREAYPITRSGQKYTPKRTTPVVDELDQLRRNTTYNSQKKYSGTREQPSDATNSFTGPKRKYKLSPAPIESLDEFNVSNYLQNLSSGLTIGQAAHLSSTYRAGLQRATRRSQSREKEANFAGSDDDETTTAAKVNLRINGKAQTAIVDSGAATSIITKTLLDRLEFEVDSPSKLVVVTANGARTKSLGIVSNLPVTIGRINIPTSFQVLESKDEVLILGNEWLREANAIMDWERSTLTIKKDDKIVKIPITFTKTSKVDIWEDPNIEDDYDEQKGTLVYYSDNYSSEDNLEYNPWIENKHRSNKR